MAVISANIGMAKTIRDFLTSNSDKIASIQSNLGGNSATTLENVDVIWDGANYYLSYTIPTNNNDNIITIAELDKTLPLTITLKSE